MGYVNGTGANPDNNKYNDVYVAFSKVFGKGEGQSAGQGIGVFSYFGRQPTDFTNTIVSPVGDINGKANHSYNRTGGDFSLNWKTLNLQGMTFRGADNRAFNSLDLTRDYEFWGAQCSAIGRLWQITDSLPPQCSTGFDRPDMMQTAR